MSVWLPQNCLQTYVEIHSEFEEVSLARGLLFDLKSAAYLWLILKNIETISSLKLF